MVANNGTILERRSEIYVQGIPKYAFGRHRRLGASGVGGLGLFGAAVRSLELTIWLNSICAGGDAVGPPGCRYGILEESGANKVKKE